MLDAVAAAAELPVATVRRAAMYAKNLGAVAMAALGAGTAALEKFQLELFSPVSPMLAQTAADVGRGPAGKYRARRRLEWKMDGARIQVHKLGDEVRIYTRSLNEDHRGPSRKSPSSRAHSQNIPWCSTARRSHSTRRAGRIPFQVTMRRFGRKLNVEALRAAHCRSQLFFF